VQTLVKARQSAEVSLDLRFRGEGENPVEMGVDVVGVDFRQTREHGRMNADF